jgi:glycosyltransferase involved in cell wall biosynthesis
MKIVFLFASLNPGGSERQTATLATRLRARGHDVTVILFWGAGDQPGNLKVFLEESGMTIHDLEREEKKFPPLLALLKELGPDVISSHGYPVTLNGSLAGYEAGIPARVIRYENTGFTREQFPQSKFFEMAGHLAATAIVGNSEAVRESFPLYWGIDEEKCWTIPNGVSIPKVTKAMQDASRRHWGADEETTLIGLLGNFREDGIKNQLLLVEALHLVGGGKHKLKAVLVGNDSPYGEQVRGEIKRQGMEQWVHTPGRIDDLDLIAGWDIAVNCSLTEGLSNAVQECMAYRLPVVASAVDGNLELVFHEESGLVFPNGDAAGLAEALRRLIKDPDERERLGRAAQKQMAADHDWESVLDQWESVYREGMGT